MFDVNKRQLQLPMETSNGNSTGSTKKDETEKIHEEMQLLKQQLKEKDAMITQLQQHILTLETEQPLQKKKRRLENDDWELQANDAKDDEIERLTKENDKLKQKPGSWTETDVEDSLRIGGEIMGSKFRFLRHPAKSLLICIRSLENKSESSKATRRAVTMAVFKTSRNSKMSKK